MTEELGPDGRVAIVPSVVDVCVLYRQLAPVAAHSDAGEGFVWTTLLLKRGTSTRCPGSWEVVHGRIERGERPEVAAVREVREETGFAVQRLYAITVNAFYLAGRSVQAALVFAAIVGEGSAPPAPSLGVEHEEAAWHALLAAEQLVTWPREREALQHIAHLLRTGDAGVAEDVLRVLL